MKPPALLVCVLGAGLAGCALDPEAEVTTAAASSELTVPSFTYGPTPVHVGVPTTFDGSASVCGTSTCAYTWQWFFPRTGGGTQVGGQMGSGTIVTYSFDAFAASKPFVIVQLKLTENNSTHNFRTTSQSFVVTP